MKNKKILLKLLSLILIGLLVSLQAKPTSHLMSNIKDNIQNTFEQITKNIKKHSLNGDAQEIAKAKVAASIIDEAKEQAIKIIESNEEIKKLSQLIPIKQNLLKIEDNIDKETGSKKDFIFPIFDQLKKDIADIKDMPYITQLAENISNIKKDIKEQNISKEIQEKIKSIIQEIQNQVKNNIIELERKAEPFINDNIKKLVDSTSTAIKEVEKIATTPKVKSSLENITRAIEPIVAESQATKLTAAKSTTPDHNMFDKIKEIMNKVLENIEK